MISQKFLKACFTAMCHILCAHFKQGCPSFYTDSVVIVPDIVCQPASIYLCMYLFIYSFIFVHSFIPPFSFIPDPVPNAVVSLHPKLNFLTRSRLQYPTTSLHGQSCSVLLYPTFSGSFLRSFPFWSPF